MTQTEAPNLVPMLDGLVSAADADYTIQVLIQDDVENARTLREE